MYLPLSLISKQILKHDCIISHTDSLVKRTPAGDSNKAPSTCQNIIIIYLKNQLLVPVKIL